MQDVCDILKLYGFFRPGLAAIWTDWVIWSRCGIAGSCKAVGSLADMGMCVRVHSKRSWEEASQNSTLGSFGSLPERRDPTGIGRKPHRISRLDRLDPFFIKN